EQTKSVTYSATLSNNATIIGTAKFRVSKPNIALRIVARTTTPVVGIRIFGPGQKTGLQLGSDDDAGETFLTGGQIIGENGKLAITQLVKTRRVYNAGSGNAHTLSSEQSFVLDRTPSYGSIELAVPGGAQFDEVKFADDAPAAEVTTSDSRVDVTETFKTYLMYKPDGDPANIFVAIQFAQWSWSATATNIGGVWTVAPDATYSPQASTSGTNVSDGSAFPAWDENVLGLQFR
ncbi:MAG: hypothetical protein LC126_08910, partial [Bryobacterales bacterium]|nr:hypothetical protein [Bryobacterales bacterium]